MKRLLSLVLLCFVAISPANASDLPNWMVALATHLPGFRNLPLTQIAMPGTHDALTFNIDKEKRASGKLGLAVKTPGVGTIVTNLSKAQGDDLAGQFNNGARYFDLRITVTDQGFEGVHGLYNGPIEGSFRAFKKMLEVHPGEIVFLDFQQVDAPDAAKKDLITLMNDIFGDLLYTPSQGPINATYGSIIARGKQVILLFKQAESHDTLGISFNRAQSLRSKWHNESDPKALASAILVFEKTNKRRMDKLNIIQAQTTPSTTSVVKGLVKSFFSSGQNNLQSDAQKSLVHQNGLLAKAQVDPDFLEAINIFMVDHLTATQANSIIDLNRNKVSP